MTEEKVLIDKVLINQDLVGFNQNAIKLPENVARILDEKHAAISEFVDLSPEQLEKEETGLMNNLLRGPREHIYSILGITTPPEVFSQITETMIRQRQILNLKADNN